MLGCEPYISGNVGSGTVEELAKWVEYMTSDGDTPMAKLRRQNGRDKAWKVKFLGVGNESWGCGGNMRLSITQTSSVATQYIAVNMTATSSTR